MMSRALFLAFASLLLVSCGNPASGPNPASNIEIKLQPNGASAALPKAPGTPMLSVDRIGAVMVPLGKPPVAIAVTDDIVVSGFGIYEPNQSLGAGVDVVIDSLPFTAHYHIERPDVATYYKMPEAAKSGYQFTLPAKFFGKGRHILTVRLISGDGKSYRESPPFTIDIQ